MSADISHADVCPRDVAPLQPYNAVLPTESSWETERLEGLSSKWNEFSALLRPLCALFLCLCFILDIKLKLWPRDSFAFLFCVFQDTWPSPSNRCLLWSLERLLLSSVTLKLTEGFVKSFGTGWVSLLFTRFHAGGRQNVPGQPLLMSSPAFRAVLNGSNRNTFELHKDIHCS